MVSYKVHRTGQRLSNRQKKGFFSTYVPDKAFSVCIKDSVFINQPYNTGKSDNFIYNDKFDATKQEYLGNNGESDDEGNRLVKNMETNGRFHSDWLSMMYPRLIKARNLLSDDGVIFISIDDHEVENLKKICDEIFGTENFITIFIRKGSGGRQDSKYFAIVHEYILMYSKNIDYFVSGKILKIDEKYPLFDEIKKRRYKTQLLRKWGENSKRSDRPNLFYPIKDPNGNDFYPMLSENEEGCWRWGQETMKQNILNGNIEFKKKNDKWVAYEKLYEPEAGEYNTKLFSTIIDDISNNTGAPLLKSIFNIKVFDYPKPVDLIIRIIKLTNSNDIILDFFSGSATTAHAVMQLNAEDGGNRKYIMVQLPEPCEEKSEAYKAGYKNICEIGKERIRRANKKIEENLKNEISTQQSIIISSEENIEKTIEEIAKKQDNLNKIKQGALDESLVKDNKKLEKLENEVQNLNEKVQRLEETIENAKETKEQKEKILANMDFGFRVLRLDSSNMKDVFYCPRDLKKDDLLSYASNIKEGRTEFDLLFQAMPEIAGADYNAKIEEISISGKKVFKVNNNYIVACFEENINEEVIREIAKMKPVYAVFRDGSFSNDSLLSNLEQIFGFESSDTELKIL